MYMEPEKSESNKYIQPNEPNELLNEPNKSKKLRESDEPKESDEYFFKSDKKLSNNPECV